MASPAQAVREKGSHWLRCRPLTVEPLLLLADRVRRLPNALVQLQARYHRCGEAASEKCLSAATFVRSRARDTWHSIAIAAVSTHSQRKSVNSPRRGSNCIDASHLAESSNPKSVGCWFHAIKAEPTLRICVTRDRRGAWRRINNCNVNHSSFDRVTCLVLQDCAGDYSEICAAMHFRNFDDSSEWPHWRGIAYGRRMHGVQ
jgi:hypothetical protein